MAYRNKSTAKTTWRERNKAQPHQTNNDKGDSRKGLTTHGPASQIRGSGTDVKNMGYLDHNDKREPFAGGAIQYAPKEVRMDPEKAKLWKKYVAEMKRWWNNEMRAERSGPVKQWSEAALKNKRSIENR